MKIAEKMGLSPNVAQYVYPRVTSIPTPDPTLLYGVELEIENTDSDLAVQGMRAVEDGSLRNNGWEFVTQPMTLSNLNHCLSSFFDGRGFDEENYSERCSVHVHTNCLDLTFSQLAAICMLYQVFEGVLFNFIGNDRDKNIFCVPWSETNLSYRTVSRIEEGNGDAFHAWQKYTALNLIPVINQGTIEWRHMAGTHEYKTIILWCQLIGSIYAYARKHPVKAVREMLVSLNNTSAYARVMDDVFNEYAHVLRIPGYEVLLENGVLNMKYSLLDQTNKAFKVPPRATFNWNNVVTGANANETRAIFDELATFANAPIPAEVPPQVMRQRAAALRDEVQF